MSSDVDWLKGEVAALYLRNRQQGHAAWANADYDFVCPSMETYPFQWLWDSCFHAIVLSHLDVERAKAELRSLLHNQQPDGFVGHVTFWQREKFEHLVAGYDIAYRTRHVSDCMQPPLLAEAIAAVVRRGGGSAFRDEVLPKARAFYDWLDRKRDPDGDGLIAVVQADETGLDHSPKFDRLIGNPGLSIEEFTKGWQSVAHPYAAHGRDHERMFAQDHFIVEEVMVNTIYGHNLGVLAALYADAGDKAAATELKARQGRTYQALLKKCWDDERGLFFDLSGRAEAMLRTNTFTCFMPLLFPELPEAIVRRLVMQLEDAAKYACAFPVPSVAMDEPSFRPGVVGTKLVWRGPTWMNSNWYLVRGLRAHGRAELAAKIVEASVAMVRRSGFREYYQPLTGEGLGAPDFSWTGLVLDLVMPG